MRVTKLNSYFLGLAIGLFISSTNAIETGKCLVETDPETVTAITGKPNTSGKFWLWWQVEDKNYAKGKTYILKSSLSSNPDQIVSATNYKISGEELIKYSRGNDTTYDSLGHIQSFSGFINKNTPYIIDLILHRNKLFFSFNNMLSKNVVCEVIYNDNTVDQTIHLPSQKEYNQFTQ